MSKPKHGAKVDRNQGDIVAELKKIGCNVEVIGTPVDLLVGFRGRNYLLEVKVPKSKGERGGKKTEAQEEFFATWRGQKAIVQSPDDALRAVGAVQ